MQKGLFGAPGGPSLELSGVPWERLRPRGGTKASRGGSGSSMGRKWAFHRGILFKSDKRCVFSSSPTHFCFSFIENYRAKIDLGAPNASHGRFIFAATENPPAKMLKSLKPSGGGVSG